MRILYLSSHSVLEYDEVSLLHSLGHYVFSPGAYVEPDNPGDTTLRPPIPGLTYDPEDVRLYHACGQPGRDNKERLSRELVERFDAVVIMHIPEWIIGNWEAFRGKRIIWRTIGQSIAHQEAALRPLRDQGLQVVRYSPYEERIPGYIGADAVIRFAKRPEDWDGWTGEKAAVLHIGQDVIKRARACSYDFYEGVTRPFPRTLIGNGSEVVPWGRGKVSYEEMRKALREHRVLFFTGTHPASYTLGFIEALMTGVPVVASGNIHGNDLSAFPGHPLYEVADLLTSNGAGFASDDPFELQDAIRALLNNHAAAERMGGEGRALAIRLFCFDNIAAQWKAFLG